MSRRLLETGLAAARGVWRGLPSDLREGPLSRWVGGRLRDGIAGGVEAQPWRAGPASSIVVSAFFNDTSGVATAGCMTACALERAGLRVERHDLGALLDAGGFQAHDLPGAADGVWLIHANPPEAKLALARLRREGWERRFRIGYWAWELPRAPADWLRAAAAFHAVWAPSRFTLDSLDCAACPRVLRPHPAPDVGVARPDRARFGLPETATAFLTLADLKSGAKRKNPLGAVEAFRRAWPQPQEEAVLVVKTQSAAADPAWLRELRAAADRPDIRLIDAALPREALLSLMASCDALVCLHRSEGFGLPVAEALALHRAVLVTGWSGTEVIAADLPEAARAPYRLVPVDDPGGPYHDLSQTWAEPDLDAAAQRLRALASDPALRRAVAAAGGAALARLDAAWTPEVLYAEPWAAGVAAAG